VGEIVFRQALRDSVDEVLEKMFFAQTLGEPSDVDEAGDSLANAVAVELRFEGEPSGSLCLRLTADAAREIAADFLGMEGAEISAGQISEVVRELANMICGSVLSRVESAATFRLGVPRIVTAGEECAESLWNTRYRVQLSHGRLTVNIGAGTTKCPQPVQSAY
jgi:CheY-specific phosphatase CheX